MQPSCFAPMLTYIEKNFQENHLPPEWIRVKEAVAYSRLSKAKLYDLMGRGLIKSSSLRERGMVRGTRLVSFDSLRAFIEARSSGGENFEAKEAGRTAVCDEEK